MHYFPRPWASEEGGGETGFTQWEMLEMDTFTSDARWKCFKFAVFPILGVFVGFVGHIVHDSSPPIKFRGDAPAKHQLAKPEPIGPMLNGNLCAT